MGTYAVITNGVVSNVIAWDGQTSLGSNVTTVNIDSVAPAPGIGWAYANGAFTAPAAPAAPTPTRQSIFLAAVEAGFDTGLGWHLPLDDGSRNLITSGAALINAAITSLNLAGNSTGVTAMLAQNFIFVDMTGAPQTVTTQQALGIMVGYGNYYNTIWSAAQ